MEIRTSRSRLLLAVGLLAVALGVGVFLAFGPGDGAATDPRAALPAGDPSGPAAPATVARAGAEEDADARRLAEAARVETRAFPAAYERALSGLVGRIVEPEGAPVEGVPVELLGGLLEFFTLDIDRLLFDPESFDLQISRQERRTAPDGTFRFEQVDPRGYYVLGINLGKGRPLLQFVDRAPGPGESVDLGDIHLDPWLTYTGRVIDPSGRGIAGARVRATTIPAFAMQAGLANLQKGTGILARLGRGSDAPKLVFQLPRWTDFLFDKEPAPRTTTGPDGSFRIEGVPAGQVSLVVDGPGLAAHYQGPIPSTSSREKHVGDVVVPTPEELDGLVVDLQDAPVPGAEVMVGIPSPLAKEFVSFLKKPVKADAAGRFRATGLSGNSVVVIARAPGMADWSTTETVELVGDEVRIRVPAPRSVLVKVRDGAGAPLAAKIAAQRAVRGLSLFPQLESPLAAKVEPVEAGVYRVRGLKEGDYHVYARSEGFAVGKADFTIEAAGEPVAELVLDREVRLEVTVLGKEDGEPVPLEAATVFGAPDRGFETLGFMALGNARTDARGIAQVPALGEGKFFLVATHPAYAPAVEPVELPGATAATIQLVLGGSIEGLVHHAGAYPEKPMMVAVTSRGRAPQPPRTTITDLEGRFRFTHLAPGNYSVIALPRLFDGSLTQLNPMDLMRMGNENASARCEVLDETATRVDIDLATGGREPRPDDGSLAGSVFLNGAAAEGSYVSASGAEWVRPVKVEANGAFDLGPVRAGDYTVSLTSRGGAPFSTTAARRVSVATGERAYVEMFVETGRLRGIVRDGDGRPVGGATVRARMQETGGFGGLRALTDSDGTFAIDEVGSGAYTVSARADGLVEREVAADVPARGSSAVVEIRLARAIAVEGTFDAALPEGFRFGWMTFRRKQEGDAAAGGGRRFGGGGVDVDWEKKTFRAAQLEPGTYLVELNAVGGGDSGARDGRLGRGGAPTRYAPVEYEVPPGGTKSAFLRFAPAPPPAK